MIAGAVIGGIASNAYAYGPRYGGYYGGPGYGYYGGGYAPGYYGYGPGYGYGPAYGYAPAYYGGYAPVYAPRCVVRVVRPAYYAPRYYRSYGYRW